MTDLGDGNRALLGIVVPQDGTTFLESTLD